jgi:hypothetical protein
MPEKAVTKILKTVTQLVTRVTKILSEMLKRKKQVTKVTKVTKNVTFMYLSGKPENQYFIYTSILRLQKLHS